MEAQERELIENIKNDIEDICGSCTEESEKLVKAGVNYLLSNSTSEDFQKLLKTYAVNLSYNAECSDSQRHVSSIKAGFKRLEGVLFLDDIWGGVLNSYVARDKSTYKLLSAIDDIYLDIPSGKPTKEWLVRLEEVIESQGREQAKKILKEVISLLVEEKSVLKNGLFYSNEKKIFTILNAYKGIAEEIDSPDIKSLAQISYTKVPYIGPLSTPMGNLCLEILESMDGTAGLVALSDLSIELKYPANAGKLVLKRLEAGAETKGVNVEDLRDQLVPDFGLS